MKMTTTINAIWDMGVSFMLNTFEVKKKSKYNIFLLLPSSSIGSNLDVRASFHVLMRISA